MCASGDGAHPAGPADGSDGTQPVRRRMRDGRVPWTPMSYCADDNAGYFETIQLYFIQLTRKSMFLSGRDLELLDEWRERGAGASAVCKGLRDAVEAMPDGDPPRDVYACRRYIEPYVERAEERSVGGHEPDGTRDSGAETETPESSSERTRAEAGDVVERALDRIERAGRRTDDESLREIYREAWVSVRDLLDAEDVGERFEGLAAVEEALVDGYFRALDRAEQNRIERRIAEDDETLLEGMSPDARRQHLRARRRRILMEEHDLISLLDYDHERASHE